MKIIKKEGVFIRKEESLGQKNTLIFSDLTNEMYEASEEYYDVIQACCNEITFDELLNVISKKYYLSKDNEIETLLRQVINQLRDIGVLSIYE